MAEYLLVPFDELEWTEHRQEPTRTTTQRFALPALLATVTVTLQKVHPTHADVRAALDAALAELGARSAS